MAMRARVELRGSLTHDGGGRTFKKGSPRILTSPSEIRYYQEQAGFSVTVLDATAKAKPPVESDEGSEPESDNDYTKAELVKLRKAELIEIAEELNLDADGTMNELISRILGEGEEE